MSKYTLTNDFHGTKVNVVVDLSGTLSESQIKRIRRTLCGVKGCRCGGYLSERGPQTVDVFAHSATDIQIFSEGYFS